MSEIEISDIKYLVQENYISDIDGKKLESALKLQELVKKWEKDLVSAPLDEQPMDWHDHEISGYLADLIKESEKKPV